MSTFRNKDHVTGWSAVAFLATIAIAKMLTTLVCHSRSPGWSATPVRVRRGRPKLLALCGPVRDLVHGAGEDQVLGPRAH